MKLFKIIKNYNRRVVGNLNIEISGLYHKDTEVKEGGLFFCLRGTKVDGTNYIKSAINNGAVAIVVENEIPNIHKITQIIVKNAREAMSFMAAAFYGNPAEKLKIIAVTGTNGKTTTSGVIANILNFAGRKTAIIGTNGIVFEGQKFDVGMTTPDPIELRFYLSKMVKKKCEFVSMEVSAHAIDLFKVEGIKFELVIWTNLSEDHLDYFKTMENYFEVKAKLFEQKRAKFALINIDDFYGKVLCDRINLPYATYSIKEKATYFANQIAKGEYNQEFCFNNQYNVKINLMGRFNVSNSLAAIAALLKVGIDIKTIISGFLNIKEIEGRFNYQVLFSKKIIIDYAHTPDGLENILMAAKEIADGKKVIALFGCGGNRESQKRAKMGEIASKIADFVIISSDNPRFEKKETIAKEIEKGMTNKNYLIELDRSKAIKKAIEMATAGDVVVIAGKGAEKYIEENGVKIPYSDYDEVEKIRRGWWKIIVWLLSLLFMVFCLRL